MRTGSPGRTLRLLGGLLALYLAVPLGAFLLRLVRSPNAGFAFPGLWSALLVSAETATISAAVIAFFGLPLAYVLARSRSRFAGFVGLVAQLPLALPPLMSGILLIYIVGPYSALGRFFHGRLTESIAGIVLAQSFVAAPFLIAVARAAFAEVDPALFDLAATLGHGEYSRFFRVALRAARGGVAAGILLAWLRAFGEYGATVILAYHPYSLPVFTYLQFSGAGLPNTEAPTALALGVATVVVLGAHYAAKGRPRAHRDPPSTVPATPRPSPQLPLRFSLTLRLGTFKLELAHQARSATLAILGPSGSGKSATLRAIAGLFGTGAGTVYFGEEKVSDLPVERRRVGYVPQSGSLFPDLPVWRQVNFGRRNDPALGAYWLERLGLAGLAARLPAELSGGERQRVHLAQALAAAPRLLLLDEPFSALDAPVREALRLEFRRLQREAGLSSVLVTHDPQEAAMLADELLIISRGSLLQSGSREEVFGQPASAEVARLLGIENVLAGTYRAGRLRAGTLELPVVGRPSQLFEGPVEWCVPADQVRLGSGAAGAVVLDVIDRGLSQLVVLGLGEQVTLLARVAESRGLLAGERVHVEIDPETPTIWPVDPATGR